MAREGGADKVRSSDRGSLREKEKALRDERSACRFAASEYYYWTDSVTVVLLVTGLAPPVVALMVTV